MWWIPVILTISFSLGGITSSSPCPSPHQSACDTLLFGEIISASFTALEIQNAKYLKGTACQQTHTDNDHAQILVNWLETRCYNSSDFELGKQYVFCCTRDQWNRCHLSQDTHVIPSHFSNYDEKGEDNSVASRVIRTKRQNQGIYNHTIAHIIIIMCITAVKS